MAIFNWLLRGCFFYVGIWIFQILMCQTWKINKTYIRYRWYKNGQKTSCIKRCYCWKKPAIWNYKTSFVRALKNWSKGEASSEQDWFRSYKGLIGPFFSKMIKDDHLWSHVNHPWKSLFWASKMGSKKYQKTRGLKLPYENTLP